MKKIVLTVLFATVAGALTFGAAASLPVSSQNLGSGGIGVVSCDTDGVEVSLLGPWFDAGGAAYSEETVNLADVPGGAVCRVGITRGSSPVKGSTTAYLVQP